VKLLLDLNVLLDVVLDRRPHVTSAAALWASLEAGGGRGCVPAHGVITATAVRQRAQRLMRAAHARYSPYFSILR
jgi:predicted nucleic acid-binding protein